MELPATVAVCSFRLGGTDGVAIEATKWIGALATLGVNVRTVAGAGVADVLLPGLALGENEPPTRAELEQAFSGADLVVVENLCSLPLNPHAATAVAQALCDRPAVLHHHDLASQRSEFAHLGPPPDDPSWLHVCVNRRTTTELQAHGYRAVTLYNAFDPSPPLGDRAQTRANLGVEYSELLVVQPTRAIARKAIPAGIALAEALSATYWLFGPAEDGYDEECARLLARARTPVIFGHAAARNIDIDDAYGAADVIALPSTWEGFGNPALESATHRRPLAIGAYPVSMELRRFGFSWFDANRPEGLIKWIDSGEEGILEKNAQIAARHFSLADLPARLQRCIDLVPPVRARRNGHEQGMLPSATEVAGTIDGE